MIPMSFAQRRMWFQWRVEGSSATYNNPTIVRLTGHLNRGALATALRDVIGRHEVLRTVFPEAEGTPQQRILESTDLSWELSVVRVVPDEDGTDDGAATGRQQQLVAFDDLPWHEQVFDLPTVEMADDLPGAEVAAADLAAAVARTTAYEFDLSTEIPVRAWLFAIAPDEHVLVTVIHHIATDGWSGGPFMRDLSVAYAARSEGRAPGWEPLPVQYADYALWQRELLGDEDDPDSVIARQVAHWREALAGAPEELTLPADRPRPAVPTYRGHANGIGVPAAVHRGLVELARRTRTTVPMVLQAALAVTLSRLGAGDDIPLGVPVAGRSDEALDDLIGCFVNTLVIRADLSGNPTFTELLERVRAAAVGAYAHQDVPFDMLVESLAPTRSLSRHPLFQSVLAPLDTGTVVELPGLRGDVLSIGRPRAKFDLEVTLGEVFDEDGAPAGLRGAVMASADLFDVGSVGRVAGCVVRVLEAVVADAGVRVGAVDVLEAGERGRLVEEWNATGVAVGGVLVPELF
uniref:condensation domain-containing protein n=1 Tax=Streptomyces shenzhenensis TaxID=943815 RepID=UPI00215D6386